MNPTESTISGKNIFFNFVELKYENIYKSTNLIEKIKNGELDGFVLKNVFSEQEMENVKNVLYKLTDDQVLVTPSGKLFPAPFAIITDIGERLNTYFNKLGKLDELVKISPEINDLFKRLNNFLKIVGAKYEIKTPYLALNKKQVSAGTFRIFLPNQGGLHVHCGNLFQAQSEFYYSLIENDLDKNNQLSYFIVIQQPEIGGELTIYDLIWDKVKRKSSPEENDSVIDDNGNIIYLKDTPQFSVKPLPGDIVVFSGGPIWHRVEDIKGTIPRITLGGFLNFSKDEKELFYWS